MLIERLFGGEVMEFLCKNHWTETFFEALTLCIGSVLVCDTLVCAAMGERAAAVSRPQHSMRTLNYTQYLALQSKLHRVGSQFSVTRPKHRSLSHSLTAKKYITQNCISATWGNTISQQHRAHTDFVRCWDGKKTSRRENKMRKP